MGKKTVIWSATATAAIAASFVGADTAEASSYKVKSGDTLWGIAQKHNLSVNQLKSINNLTKDTIYVNQTLKTTDTASSSSSNSNQNTSKQSTTGNSNSNSTYTIKSGDSLSKIAAHHNMSLTKLMELNNLSTTLIYPGDTLKVTGSANFTTSSQSIQNSTTSSSSSSNSSSSETSTYTVKSGDTLSRIGSQYNVSVSDLKKWNGLSSDTIYVGQKLTVQGKNVSTNNSGNSSADNNEQVSKPNAPSSGFDVNRLIQTANSQLGKPYVWGGSSPSTGFDCSGFIHYAYNDAGKSMGRTSTEGYYNRSFDIPTPSVGDLVFFEGTYKSGISHMGIYVGNNQFIHAGGNQVQVTSLDNPYWKKHFHSYKRFY